MASTYTTKGLPPPPTVSMTTRPIAGLLADLYGLEELPPFPAPITCLWLFHPRTHTRTRMSDVARRTISAWAGHPGSRTRGLVAVAMDMPNHGSRMVSEEKNGAWDEGNGTHALDMLSMIKGGARDASEVMDVVGGYLGRKVDGHVVLGWSLGGHAAWQAWWGEERVDAGVVVVGCPDYMSLMSSRAEVSGLNLEAGLLGSAYFPQDLIDTCFARDPKGILFGTAPVPETPLEEGEKEELRGMLKRVSGKKILVCSGGADKLVPYEASAPFLGFLKDAVTGWWEEGGVEVRDVVYEGVGHRFSAEMVTDAVEFLVDAVARGPRRVKPRI